MELAESSKQEVKREHIDISLITQNMNEHEKYNFYQCWLGRENDEKN